MPGAFLLRKRKFCPDNIGKTRKTGTENEYYMKKSKIIVDKPQTLRYNVMCNDDGMEYQLIAYSLIACNWP